MNTDQPDTAAAGSPGTSLQPDAGGRRWGLYAVVLLAVFLAGLLPMWWTARANGLERDAARSAVRASRLQNTLANAAIDARRGEYESARQSASVFFTDLRSEIDLGPQSSLDAAYLEGLKPLLDGRDDIITLLARSDPASVERLMDFYVRYRAASGAAPAR